MSAGTAIHALAIPTPFAVGRVNCYLVEDDPLTLVDAGPNSATSLTTLEAALAEHGRRIEDLERIVITHQHIDHIGLVAILADRSGAEVCALDALAPWLARYSEVMEADDAFAEAIMLRHGIPPDIVIALRAVTRSFRAWGASCSVDTPLADAALLEFAGRTWRVHHRPGTRPRTPSSTTRPRASWSAATTSSSTSRPTRSSRGRSTAASPASAQGARRLPGLAARHAGDGRTSGAPRPRRADRGPPRAHRRALRHARPARAQAARPDRRASPQRPRAGSGAVGQRGGDPGLPDAQRGARPRRPAARRRARRAGGDRWRGALHRRAVSSRRPARVEGTATAATAGSGARRRTRATGSRPAARRRRSARRADAPRSPRACRGATPRARASP